MKNQIKLLCKLDEKTRFNLSLFELFCPLFNLNLSLFNEQMSLPISTECIVIRAYKILEGQMGHLSREFYRKKYMDIRIRGILGYLREREKKVHKQ
jgi:hypothetical protein